MLMTTLDKWNRRRASRHPSPFLVRLRRRALDRHSQYSAIQVLEDRTLLSSISGIVFEDLNGNQNQDVGEGPLSGVTVYLDSNNNEMHDTGEPSSISDANGNYLLDNLQAGDYIVRQVVPNDYRQTTPATSGRLFGTTFFGNHDVVELDPVTGNELNRFSLPTQSANFTQGLAYDGQSLFYYENNSKVLYELNRSTGGVLDSYNLFAEFANRNIGGLTAYGGLVYMLDVTSNANRALITFDPAGNGQVTNVVNLGNNFNFGGGLASLPDENQVIAATSSTLIFYDPSTGQILDRGLLPNSNLTPTGLAVVADEIFVTYGTTVTEVLDRDGNLLRTLNNPTESAGLAGGPGGGGPHRVTLNGTDDVTNRHFGNQSTLGRISGIKFEDENDNGIRDPGEGVLAGVTIYLDDNKNGAFDNGEAFTTTAADGSYEFLDLVAGDYVVREVVPAGFYSTTQGNDPGKFYGAAYIVGSGGQMNYVEIDAITGVVNRIGNPLNVNLHGLVRTNSGDFYGINALTDSLYQLNATTGAVTLIGATNAHLSASLAYDHFADTIYGIGRLDINDNNRYLLEFDRTTGGVTQLGSGTLGIDSLSGAAFDPINQRVIGFNNNDDVVFAFELDGTASVVSDLSNIGTWSLTHTQDQYIFGGLGSNSSQLRWLDIETGNRAAYLIMSETTPLETLDWAKDPSQYRYQVGEGQIISGVDFSNQRINFPPSVSLSNATTMLLENVDVSSAIKVADIVVVDDGLGTAVLSLSGTDAILFEIVGTELRLKANSILDADGNAVLDVAVDVDDPAVGSTPDDSAALAINVVGFDYGDAPAPYPTLDSDNGAVHIASGPRLGSHRDTEPDGFPSLLADGDDKTDLPDDEDGVTFGVMTAGESGFQIDVDVQNAPSGAFLNAWIDFDGDGIWEPSEQIANSQAVTAGSNTVTFNVPTDATPGFTYARLRLSTDDGSDPTGPANLDPTGPAHDGEVEDYRVRIRKANGATFSTSDGQLTVRGTGFSDDIVVQNNGGIVEIVDGGTVINTGISLASLTSIRVLGNDSDDFLTLDSSLGAITGFLFGEMGNDTLTGGDGGDIINGGAGNDILLGGIGNDALTGAAGIDSYDGGANDDRLALDGDDLSIQGGTGRDTADAAMSSSGINLDMVPAGLEVFFGSAFDDIVTAAGSTTAVEMRGAGGNDQLTGGNLGDLIFGGMGNDILLGGDGGDYLNGGQGVDSADGGLGNDRIDFEASDSSVQGGTGTDTASATGSGSGVNVNMTTAGLERLIGSQFADVITAAGSTAGVVVLGLGGNDQITGGDGVVDILLGGSDDDTISGGNGGDVINGEAGADSLDAGAGDDRIDFDENDTTVQGGTGTDQGFATGAGSAITLNMVAAGLEVVFGSPFNDVITAAGSNVPVQINGLDGADDLTGGNEADVLRGGNDNDTLTGGPEDDALLGQAGADTFVIEGNDNTDFNAAEGDVLI